MNAAKANVELRDHRPRPDQYRPHVATDARNGPNEPKATSNWEPSPTVASISVDTPSMSSASGAQTFYSLVIISAKGVILSLREKPRAGGRRNGAVCVCDAGQFNRTVAFFEADIDR